MTNGEIEIKRGIWQRIRDFGKEHSVIATMIVVGGVILVGWFITHILMRN